MVLLHLILRKQHETLEQWQVKQGVAESDDGWQLASDVQEMDAALFELILAFHERFKSLQRSWRSQKLDIDLQIQSFSGGLFCGWYVRVSTVMRVSIERNDFNYRSVSGAEQ
jgi:hypothetical protein